MTEPFQIPIGKQDWVTAIHDPAKTKTPSDLLVILVHGFPGDRKNFGDVLGNLSTQLNAQGYDSLRFEFRGCGDSSKRSQFFTLETAFEDMLSILKWARDNMKFTRIVIVAEGLGALNTLTALTDAWRDHVAGLVFLWPIFDPGKSWLAPLTEQIAMAEIAGLDHVAVENAELGLPFLRQVRDYKLQKLLSRIAAPTQIHYGESDLWSDPAKIPGVQNAQVDLVQAAFRAGTAGSKAGDKTAGRLEITGYADGDQGLKTTHARNIMTKEILGFLKSLTPPA
ncbi:alpha/beta hydrolase [Micavibrio aeruginosavorus]|uniref:alpha/beta hydrolase n=1 Tax=Micavibrio aeruginosavorus TaxID=349221 RepID=UPI003F4AF416